MPNESQIPSDQANPRATACSNAQIRSVLMQLLNDILERQDHWESLVTRSDWTDSEREQAAGAVVGLFEAVCKIRREIKRLEMQDQLTW